MIIECENCSTKLRVDESLIRPSGTQVRCSACSHVFTVYRPAVVEAFEEKPISKNKLSPQSPCARIFTLTNQKGGVAKTTTCLNLGISFSLLKKRVLLIDFDVQASLTTCLGYKNTASFYDALHAENKDMNRVIIKSRYPHIWLLPSNRNMVLFNKKYFSQNRYEYILKESLQNVATQFDFILIDTPPSMEFFTVNALTAANRVIIPSNCEFLATQGVHQTLNFIQIIKERTNPDIDYNILVTMYDNHDTVSEMIHSKLRKMYGEKTFKTVISMDNKVRESQVMNMPIIYYYKHSPSGLRYISLAREILGNSTHG